MRSFIALLALTLSLTGCSFSMPLGTAKEVQYYVLTSPVPAKHLTTKCNIGLLPVDLPGYLSRPQLVERNENGVDIRIHDFHRWGEELSRGIARVVCDTMADEGISVVPLRTGTRVDSKLILDIRRLDGMPDGNVTLDAVWVLQKGQQRLASGHIVDSRPAGNDLQDMVEAQSLLVQDMSRNIAASLK